MEVSLNYKFDHEISFKQNNWEAAAIWQQTVITNIGRI